MEQKPIIGGARLAQAVREAYSADQTDYSMQPIVLCSEDGSPLGEIRDGDSVIFCCRRGEREIQLTEAFTQEDFTHFNRKPIQDLDFVILTLYHEKFKDLKVAFAPQKIQNTLGDLVSRAGLRQLRTAESEKFAHVTFFLNGGNNQPADGETDIKIPSPRGIPFDHVPALSLPEVKDQVLAGLQESYDLIITNFANGDVIGHTANNAAKVECARVIDEALSEVLPAAALAGYDTLILADHGNLEWLVSEDGAPHVAHTTSLVPFIHLPADGHKLDRPRDGILADVAPTVLHLLGLSCAPDMDGQNLLPTVPTGSAKKVLLIILDGWGFGPEDERNPIHLAQTPCWDRLLCEAPNSRLEASGVAVGLKAGKAGNSEAGHMNIGAGRIVMQDDVRLDLAMKDGSFTRNPVLLDAVRHALQNRSRLHLIGLLTEKSSHGSIDYPLAILGMAKSSGLNDVCLHMILDGRSTEPGSAPALLEMLANRMEDIGAGQIVSCIGRGLALDRDGNYAKTEKAYRTFVEGIGAPACLDGGL